MSSTQAKSADPKAIDNVAVFPGPWRRFIGNLRHSGAHGVKMVVGIALVSAVLAGAMIAAILLANQAKLGFATSVPLCFVASMAAAMIFAGGEKASALKRVAVGSASIVTVGYAPTYVLKHNPTIMADTGLASGLSLITILCIIAAAYYIARTR